MCRKSPAVLPWRLALGALALALLASPVLAGAAATRFSDKIVQTGGQEIPGEITEESIDGIKITGSGGQVEVNLRSVVRVEYSDAPQAFRDGEDKRKVGAYDEAISKYQTALTLNARRFWIVPACKFHIAMCQVEEGSDPGAAEAGFKELLTEFPKSRYRLQALIGWGRALTAKEKYDEAIAKFKQCTDDAMKYRMDEWGLHANLYKAKAQLAAGQPEEAIATAEKVKASCTPRQTDIRVQAEGVIAAVHVRKSEYDKAITLLRESIKSVAGLVADEMEKTPGDTRLRKTEAICFNTLGLAYFRKAAKEPKEKATDDYREALLAFLWNVVLYGNYFPPEHAMALDYAARCFKELKQEGRATDLTNELKKSYPDYKAAQ